LWLLWLESQETNWIQRNPKAVWPRLSTAYRGKRQHTILRVLLVWSTCYRHISAARKWLWYGALWIQRTLQSQLSTNYGMETLCRMGTQHGAVEFWTSGQLRRIGVATCSTHQ
jgi:hypothetical protein